MKNIRKAALVLMALIILVLPFSFSQALPDNVAVGKNNNAGADFGGILPDSYEGILNSGRTVKFTQADASIININKDQDGNTVTVSLKTFGTSGRTLGDVFFAAYDENGRFVAISGSQKAAVGTDVYVISGTAFAGASSIKAFIWDLETSVPFCETMSV